MNDQEQTLGGAGGASGTAVWPYALPQGDPRHGTGTGYDYWRCRCDDCRAANRTHHLAYMHRTGRAKPLAEHRLAIRAEAEARDNHGTETRYNKGGCRCRECRDAIALARRLRRQRATTTAGRSPA